jgi:hypothetical protein
MTCPTCGGALETSPNGAYARCQKCQKIFMTHGGQLRPVDLPPGTDPALFASGVGFPSAAGSGQPALPPDPLTATKNAFANKASNMGVRVKVGGVSVDMDKGGVSVDTKKLQKNLERKVDQKISQYIWGCVFTVFFFGVVAAILAVLGGYIALQVVSTSGGGSSGSAEAADWDGTAPYDCPVNGNVTLSGVTANLPGKTAINAAANCHLTIENCDITADTVVDAGGNAVVTITGGHINGSTAAINAMGNAKVTVSGTKVEGPTEHLGNAKISGI